MKSAQSQIKIIKEIERLSNLMMNGICPKNIPKEIYPVLAYWFHINYIYLTPYISMTREEKGMFIWFNLQVDIEKINENN